MCIFSVLNAIASVAVERKCRNLEICFSKKPSCFKLYMLNVSTLKEYSAIPVSS